MSGKNIADAENALTSTQSSPRTYTPGKRRFTLYISWNYQAEAGADVTDLDNRFTTVLESRRQGWPGYEWTRDYDQGIASQMEHGILLEYESTQQFFAEATGRPVPLLQRADKTGNRQPLDERVLADTDTLILISLDHQRTRQQVTPAEVDMLTEFLAREGTCLVVCPHHDVGGSEDLEVRKLEHNHHGDMMVSGQQRFSGFARSVLDALRIPVVNQHGLNPARVKGTREPAPLSVAGDLDTKGLLRGVTTFNLHPHLPHYALTSSEPPGAVVLAQQPINLDAPPHPFVEAGNTAFNAMVWLPPAGKRAGDVLIADLTIWSGSFGGTASLQQLWRNVAQM